MLIRCIPAELKQGVLEKNSESEPIRAAELLSGILENLQPGGTAEMASISSFIRALQPVNSATEALSTLRRWKLARARASSLSMPSVAAYEELQALGALVRNLERKHDRLRTVLGLLRTRPEIVRPTTAGVDSFLELVEQQLQLLSADEHVRSNRQHVDPPDPQASKGKGKGKPGKQGDPSTKRKPCQFLAKFGKCRFGDKCFFSHDRPAQTPNTAPLAPPPTHETSSAAVVESGTECLIWKKTGKCRFGKKCKFHHATADAAAPKASPKPAAKPKAAPAVNKDKLVGATAKASAVMSMSTHASRSTAMMIRRDVESEGSESEASVVSEAIPMHAEARTPEWSDVEAGVFPSEESDASSSDVDFEHEHRDGPLWVLYLNFQEYLSVRRSSNAQIQASREFSRETNPWAITWAVWFTIVRDQLDEDERGVIPIAEGVVMLRCDVVFVPCEDRVGRHVFVVHVLEEETGRERMLAVVRAVSRPVVRPRELESGGSGEHPQQRHRQCHHHHPWQELSNQ